MTTQAVMLKDPLLAVDSDFLKDPYPYYKQLREAQPVFWSKEGQYWIATRYDDVETIIHDLRFGKGGISSWSSNGPLPLRLFMRVVPFLLPPVHNILHLNPPDHTRIRSLMNKAFTPKAVEQMRSHIQQIADDLLDQALKKSTIDLVADYAFPLPVTVIAEMLGVPASDREQFKKWSGSLIAILEPGTNALKLAKAYIARKELISYLKPLVDERRKNQKEDLISTLVQAEEAGDKLSEEELLANLVLLLVAGHETTVNLISNSALALMTHPDQMQLLKDKPELLNNAIEEFLRWNSPVQIVRRIAREDIEIGDKKISSGQTVVACIGAANRDPEKFADPDRLDITRSNIKHLAFGFGIHHCIGFALATAEGQISIGTLLKRIPNMRLTNEIVWKRPFSLRGPTQLLIAQS